ncbi:MAG TPA: hypothetical protein VER32_10820 [Pyrinomonadaceae bacterium]|nr:hypothetical protein [Pyrinomonadaceae bacterium]
MANVLTIFDQVGPLPLNATLDVRSDGPALLMISGSVWTETQNSNIGITLLIDGKAVAGAGIFCNPTTQHVAVVTAYVPVQLTFGSHTFTLQASSTSTVSDFNDTYNVCLLY